MNSLHIIDKTGDIPVTFVIIRPGKSKLQLVKSIKKLTELGLRESKDIVDSSEVTSQVIKTWTTQKGLFDLRVELNSCVDLQYTLSDIQDNRHKKLIELGLGTKDDLIELLIESDIHEFHMSSYESKKVLLRQRYELISEKNLKNLLNID